MKKDLIVMMGYFTIISVTLIWGLLVYYLGNLAFVLIDSGQLGLLLEKVIALVWILVSG